MRLVDAESGLMGSKFTQAGYYRAHLRWNSQVGVLEVHAHDEVAFSTGVPQLELFAAQFASTKPCTPFDRRVYLTLGCLKVMTELEALYGATMVWHKDRIAPGVQALLADKVSAATRLLSLLNIGEEDYGLSEAKLHDLIQADCVNVELGNGGYRQLASYLLQTSLLPSCTFDKLNRAVLQVQLRSGGLLE